MNKVKAIDHESYWTYSAIAVLVPVVGFIIGAIMITKDDTLDKKLGEHTIVLSILTVIIAGFLWFLWSIHAANTPTINPY